MILSGKNNQGLLMSLSESKKQRQKEAKALLEGFWPELFRFNKPRPLKMGVFADLVEDAKQQGAAIRRRHHQGCDNDIHLSLCLPEVAE